MDAQDGSMGFDFAGSYDKVKPNSRISYTLDDGRKTEIIFTDGPSGTTITETFEAESSNSLEMQKNGWQAILENFKIYAEMQQ